MPRFSLLLCLSACLWLPLSPAARAGTILAVFAHPDDEISVGAVLAKYAAEGHDVYLVTATSGQAGAGNTNIPAGPRLGAEREKEVRCSAGKLGIHEPILIQLQDGDIAKRPAMEKLRGRLREIIDEVKPDVMVTWGPDGLTGHADHRIVSNVASEVFLGQGPQKHKVRKLYHVAFPESVRPSDPGAAGMHPRLAAVSDEFVTTVIDAGAYGEQVFEAMKYHVTQWAPLERMKSMYEARRKALGGKTYLRLAGSLSPRKEQRETDLLDGLE